ncbi:MAG: NTP transferase domain-containing protein [Elusimicrobia bacterium]|nr:NTP transferase domain-containing protein [Elusimicrobiota bacterium]
MQVAILSGGLATRLRPLSNKVAKAMVEVGGKPFLEHQIQLLARHGIKEFILCLGHLASSIQDHFKDGKSWGVRIQYSEDGAELLGTAGALKKAEALLGKTFFVLDGDAYLPLDYRELWAIFGSKKESALMVVYKNHDQYDRSNVMVDNGRVNAYDRSRKAPAMVYIHAGLSLLRREALSLIPSDRPSSQDQLWSQLISRRELLSFETSQRFYEIGSLEGLEEFRQLMEKNGRTG